MPTREEKINRAKNALSTARSLTEELHSDLEEFHENLSENAQESELGEKIIAAIDELSDACVAFDDIEAALEAALKAH